MDTVPHILDFPNSPASSASLNELHDFLEGGADGNCPQEQAVVVQLGDSEDTTWAANIPNLTTELLDELLDLSE